MQITVYFLFIISFGRCAEDFKFEVKTIAPGQNITLTCLRHSSVLYKETFYWIRLVSGNWPEFLGATFNFMNDDVSKIPHIQTKIDREEFLLHISETQQNDTGLYYCIKVRQLDFMFIKGTFVKIEGQNSDVNVVLEKPPVHPENPETLQCSVLSNLERPTCPVDNRVYWFKAGSDDSHPRLLYLQGNSLDECEKSPETPSTQKCFYDFSGTSNSGTYYCAVTACGQILFGNEMDFKENISSSQVHQVNIFICFGSALSIIILVVLTYVIKQINGKVPANVYTAVIFTVMNPDCGNTKKIYAAFTDFVEDYWSNTK